MRRMRDWKFFGRMTVYVIFICVIFAFAIFRGFWANESTAVRALEKQGYSDIRILDHSWFMVSVRGCSNSDAAKFSAVAKNPVGKEVECFVCVGWPFKGATIRTD